MRCLIHLRTRTQIQFPEVHRVAKAEVPRNAISYHQAGHFSVSLKHVLILQFLEVHRVAIALLSRHAIFFCQAGHSHLRYPKTRTHYLILKGAQGGESFPSLQQNLYNTGR